MPRISRQGQHVQRVGHPRDDAPRARTTARSTSPRASPTSRRPPELKEAACAAIRRRRQPVRHHLGREGRSATRSRPRRAPLPRLDRRPRDARSPSPAARPRAMIASMLAHRSTRATRSIVFEPFYENYGPDAILSGAVPRYVTLHEPDWSFDRGELRAAFGPRTRGDRRQLAAQPHRQGVHARRAGLIAELCQEHDVVAFTDEIYEHILYAGEHIPLATLPGHGRPHGRPSTRCRRRTPSPAGGSAGSSPPQS